MSKCCCNISIFDSSLKKLKGLDISKFELDCSIKQISMNDTHIYLLTSSNQIYAAEIEGTPNIPKLMHSNNY
jgi:hypothetical protein